MIPKRSFILRHDAEAEDENSGTDTGEVNSSVEKNRPEHLLPSKRHLAMKKFQVATACDSKKIVPLWNFINLPLQKNLN